MRVFLPATLLLSAACLAGCHADEHSITISSYITLHGETVAVHAPDRPDALINANGELTIGNKPIAVTASEHELLKQYHVTAMAIRDHGIATGKAGIETAGRALGSVASGLASGNTDKIDAEVSASVAKVDASAALICTDLAQIHTTQESLASQLEAFRPYALIKADEARHCRNQVEHPDR